jgi:hypothetical protein
VSLLKSKKVWLGLLAVLVVLAGLVLLTNTDELEDSVPTTGANQTESQTSVTIPASTSDDSPASNSAKLIKAPADVAPQAPSPAVITTEAEEEGNE